MKQKISFIAILALIWISAENDVLSSQFTTTKGTITEMSILSNWEFRQAGTEKWMPATVPGTVHNDLMVNKVIENPFIGLNENDVQWVEKEDWEYKTTFQCSGEMLRKEVVELVFEGLDTYADVYLNGNKILTTDNMFVGHRLDCRPYLHAGNNELVIYFHSAVKKGMEKLVKLDYLLPAANEQAPVGERSNVFTRKAPFHYGWDWGPRIVTAGIWRPVKVVAWDEANINDYYLVTRSANSEKAVVAAEVEIRATKKGNYNVSVDFGTGQPLINKKVRLNPGVNNFTFELTVNKPRLWWPNGLGEAHLYNVKIAVDKGKKNIDHKNLSYGIRTLQLVQNPDEIGHTFHFEVNGIPVFMKGANIIPNETLTPSVTEETYRKMIASAKDAHMNMLRVWGGAIYEEDLFYRLCDENGILIWQDFMFACALQPGDEEHLENIRLEAEYNIRRLRNYTSLALWCGNNENLHGWHKWGWKESFTPEISDFMWRTYERIFYEILPGGVTKLDPSRSYWASSPSSYGDELADRKSGDEHDWTIWFGEKPFSAFWEDLPRFVSEWGMQAFPPMATIQSFAGKENLDPFSPLMRHRQRSQMNWIRQGFDGNDMIQRYMDRFYKKPVHFDEFVYKSQLMQALAYKTAIEAHRSAMPHTMGSLYWQLNDCWPTISWATVDYYYRWKASHYAVRNAFAPVIVTAKYDGSNTKIYAVSDLLTPVNAKLVAELKDFSGAIVFKIEMPALIASNTSTLLSSPDFAQWLIDGGDNRLMLHLKLQNENEILAENILYFTEPRNLQLPETKVEYTTQKNSTGYSITLKTDRLAKDLFIDVDDPDAFVSENFFDLLPGTSKTIEVKTNATGEPVIRLMYQNQF
jgi:beta-mannosidase